MQALILSVQAIHVLPAVFWAGSTFALARSGAAGAEKLVPAQIGAMVLTVLAGAGLWKLTHDGPIGPTEKLLLVGVACAIVAAAVQLLMALPAARGLKRAGDAAPLQNRIVLAERIASLLLAVAVVCMTASRYV